MFRVTINAYVKKHLLHRHVPITSPIAHLCRTVPQPANFKGPSTPIREKCPVPKKVIVPPKENPFIWGTLTALVIAGGFIYYAKQEPELRDWLTLYAPWMDEIIAFAFAENYSHADYVKIKIREFRRYMNECRNLPPECYEKKKIEDVVVNPCALKAPDEEPEQVEEEYADDDDALCTLLNPPVVTKDICELEDCIKDLAETAMNNFWTAGEVCRVYNDAVETTMLNFTFKDLKDLRVEMARRKELVKTCVNDGNKASLRIKGLQKYIECGGVKASKDKLDLARQLMKDMQTNIKILKMEFIWMNDKSVAFDEQWQKVEAAVEKYILELQGYYPALNYNTKLPTLGNEDLDFLLIHTNKYLKNLRNITLESMYPATERINRAIARYATDEKDQKELEAKVEAEVKKAVADLDAEYAKRLAKMNMKNDKALQRALDKQKQQHEDLTDKKMEDFEKEVQAKFNKLVAEQVALEKLLMKEQLADMAAKVAIVEDKLNSRMKGERENSRSQDLWRAGFNLLQATRRGDPHIKVEKELRAIDKASGNNDKLVLSILHAVPDSVWEEGIMPESALKEKYHKMEKIALNVALVEAEGSPMPVYWLSWLQSTFLFMKLSGIPQCELDNPPKEPFNNEAELDTFDLMQRARYWVDQGNLAIALRYVNALEGASRGAAAGWQEAARNYVQTRQAAEAILAHAAAIALQYI